MKGLDVGDMPIVEIDMISRSLLLLTKINRPR